MSRLVHPTEKMIEPKLFLWEAGRDGRARFDERDFPEARDGLPNDIAARPCCALCRCREWTALFDDVWREEILRHHPQVFNLMRVRAVFHHEQVRIRLRRQSCHHRVIRTIRDDTPISSCMTLELELSLTLRTIEIRDRLIVRELHEHRMPATHAIKISCYPILRHDSCLLRTTAVRRGNRFVEQKIHSCTFFPHSVRWFQNQKG